MRLQKYKIFLALLDSLTFIIAATLAGCLAILRQGNSLKITTWEMVSFPFLLVVLLFLYLFLQQTNNLYKINVFFTIILQIVKILRTLIYLTFIFIGIAFFLKLTLVLDSRYFVVVFSFSLFILQLFLRVCLARLIFLNYTKNSLFKRKIIIIGGGKAGKNLAAKLSIEKIYAIEVIGFVDDNLQVQSKVWGGLKNLGRIEDLVRIYSQNKFDELILAIDNISYERMLDVLDFCKKNKFSVRVSSELFNVIIDNMEVERYALFPVVESSPRINSKLHLFFKRITDFVLAFLFIIVFSPVYLIISVLIKLTTKGPILFKQERMGINGQSFIFYKFRSMTVIKGEDEERKKMMLEFMKNGKENGKAGNKVINESRVTKIGKLLRKTSLDELPQFFNVLRGDMSIVGPRPCMPYEYENYEEWQKRRFDVLPGITGVWQVFGRCKVSFKDSIVLDLYYINNMSPWLDLHLILKTIPVMLNLRGGA